MVKQTTWLFLVRWGGKKEKTVDNTVPLLAPSHSEQVFWT